MSSVTASVLRACFKAFLGEQDYQKFLEAGAAEPLGFWQERAWDKFVTAHPQFNVTPAERAEALDVCPAHEKPLLEGFTDSPDGYNFFSPPERRSEFPRAPLMALVPIGVRRVKYCQQCMAAQAEYFARRDSQRRAAK